MSPKVVLPDVEQNTPFAEVDGITLTKGDVENPTDLTEDQVSRLEDAGMQLTSAAEAKKIKTANEKEAAAQAAEQEEAAESEGEGEVS